MSRLQGGRMLFLLSIVAVVLLINICIGAYGRCGLMGGACSRTNFRDNIGNIDMEDRLSYAPIDVVYTWVNGSDPIWRASKEHYRSQQQQRKRRRRRRLLWSEEDDHWTASEYADLDDYWSSYTGYHEDYALPADEDEYYEDDALAYENDLNTDAVNNSTDSIVNNTTSSINETRVVEEGADSNEESIEEAFFLESTAPTSAPTADQSASANRYRDSEELRYSLRSLEAFAPWIRHVYLVTDNQIPWWLNMDEKKLTVVPHSAIFQDKSKLPVFSSPAIESQLHNIPGISRQFIYFNDDVMLGAPTFPDDFLSLYGAQRIYLAWEAPKCNPGCSDNWIGDGTCDEACNVSSCDFDFPDCLPEDDPERIAYFEDNNIKGKTKSKKTTSKYSSQYRSSRPTSSTSAAKKATNDKHSTIRKSLDAKKCAIGCPRTWLGDGSCDTKCNVASCLWDAGDCRPIKADAPANTSNFDIAVGDHGVIVNLTGLPYLNYVEATVYEEGIDTEIVVYDSVILKQAHVLILFIDAAKAKRAINARKRAEQKAAIKSNKNASSITQSSLYFKNWTASIFVSPEKTDDSGQHENAINVSYTFRLYDPDAKSNIGPEHSKDITRRPTAVVNAVNCAGPSTIGHNVLDLSLGRDWFVSLDLAATYQNTSTSFNVHDWLVVQTGSVAAHRGGKSLKSPVAYYALNPVPLADVLLDRRRTLLDIMITKPTTDGNASMVIEQWRQALKSSAKSARKPFLWLSGALFLIPSNVSTDVSSYATLAQDHSKACISFAIEATEDWHLFDDDDIIRPDVKQNNGRRRLLLDTYGESLARVNRMYSRRFGKPDYGQIRRVPAHMPHMIDVQVLKAMQEEFSEAWRETASNRFRSGKDMQFAFAYFHYIISKARENKPDFDTVWRNEIDADGNGILDGNEIITLASMARGKEADDDYIDDIYNCVATEFSWRRWILTRTWFFGLFQTLTSSIFDTKSLRRTPSSVRAARWDRATGRMATLASTRKCERAVDGVITQAKKREERRAQSYILEPTLSEVAFEMLGDEFNNTRTQLDSIRARRSKFICINDNINDMTPELFALLQDFFQAYYPKRSRFELPPGIANTHLRLDDYLRERFWSRFLTTAATCLLAAALVLTSLTLTRRRSSSTSSSSSSSSSEGDTATTLTDSSRPKAE